MSFRLVHGDVLEACAALPAASYDAVLTDPPYGLSDPRPANSATPRRSSREATRAGFMGMRWDRDVPDAETWRAVYRVMKPGAILLAFGGTRTWHRLACAIEDAGFELRDTLMWLYGSGFPKSLNIGRHVVEFAGYGSGLKPAWEPIILAMKPCEGTFAANALKHGVAGLAIDRSRIAVSDAAYAQNCPGDRGHAKNRKRKLAFHLGCGSAHDTGRWPANLILDEESGALLDQQTGTLTSGANPTRRRSSKFLNTYGEFEGPECIPIRGLDRGGASRFFYCAKASRRERGEGNTHPTVKPQALLRYLAKLILPPGPGARLLVPFAGSGSEVIAARAAGWRNGVAIEREAEYIAIARQRLKQAA